jgi:hypothetical protein
VLPENARTNTPIHSRADDRFCLTLPYPVESGWLASRHPALKSGSNVLAPISPSVRWMSNAASNSSDAVRGGPELLSLQDRGVARILYGSVTAVMLESRAPWG